VVVVPPPPSIKSCKHKATHTDCKLTAYLRTQGRSWNKCCMFWSWP